MLLSYEISYVYMYFLRDDFHGMQIFFCDNIGGLIKKSPFSRD